MNGKRPWIDLQMHLLIASHALAILPLQTISAEPPCSTFLAPSDEALFLQRITEFWKDKDYALAAKQIEEFFDTFPNSELTDRLLVLQGDLYSSQGQYHAATECYDRIQDPYFQDKALFNRLSALFYLQRYLTLAQEAHHIFNDNTNPQNREIALYYLGQAHLALAKQSESNAKNHYTEAQKAFESLQDSTYHLSATNALIEIYHVLGLAELENRSYLTLAQKFPEKEEQFLFSAAQIQKQYSPETALETYLKIRKLEGSLASQANKDRLLLLFELHRYQDIADEIYVFQNWDRKNDGPLPPLLIGRSYYYLKRYENAISCLEPLLKDLKNKDEASAEQDKSLFKSILTPLIFSAHALNELQKEEEWIANYETYVGKDESYPEILFALAITYKNCDRLEEGESLLNKLIGEYPEFEKIESALLDLAILQFKQRKWEESRASFLALLAKNPSTEHINRVHLLLAGACDQLKRPEEFVKYAELAVEGNKSFPERAQLLQNLFIAYLKLGNGEGISSEEKQNYFKLAANHLQESTLTEDPIPSKYLEWLANYYYQQAFHSQNHFWIEPFNGEAAEEKRVAEKSQSIYLKLLANVLNHNEMASISHEEDLLKLSNLYLALDKPKESSEILTFLTKAQETDESAPWKWRAKALYMLGTYYLTLAQQGLNTSDDAGEAPMRALALSFFKKAGEQKIDPLSVYAAQLEEVCLRFELLPIEKRNLSEPDMLTLLKRLKDLQRDKKVQQEPIHLEATLEYAAIRASAEPQAGQIQLYHSLLSKFREEYLTQDDIASKEYHRKLAENPKQEALYLAYMELFEGHLAILEGKMATQKGRAEEAELKNHRAAAIYSRLLSEPPVSKYLTEAAEKGLKEAKVP